MESDATYALIENIKMMNASLGKITDRIEVLESDFHERTAKKKLFKWLFAFYPVIIIVLIGLIKADHKKISEIAGDVQDLIKDTQSLTLTLRAANYQDLL